MTSNSIMTEVAEYWNKRPCNIRHSPKKVGTREYFDEVEARKYFIEPHIPKFAEFAKWKNKRVLEIGCGIGTDTINFARSGAQVTAVDISLKSLEIAQLRATIFNLENRINFLHSNAEEISNTLICQPFDLIYSFGVLHHTENIQKAISEIKKYMEPTSELRVMLYAKNSWKQFLIDAGMDQPEAQAGCIIANSYSIEDINRLFCDFNIDSIEQDHIFPYIVEKYINYEYVKQPWFESMPNHLFRILESKLGWHALIKAKLY
jgi:2-polyprenyl-3-methyl-5-hydroxy-6-metoxy-1,4-benzoquinol methylase